MKKKLITVVLVALILQTLLLALPASAASEFTVSAGKVSGKSGGTVDMVVSVSNNPGFSYLSLTLSYDTNVLTLTSATNGTIIKDFDSGTNLMWSADSDSKANGTLVTLKFSIKAGAEKGDYPVTLKFRECYNENLADVKPTIVNGTVTVTCNHSFTEKKTTDAYFKSNATCESPKLYYYSCKHCGEKGTETFTVGEKLAHTYTEKVTSKALKSAATCTKKAVYYESCSVCGANGTKTFESGSALDHDFGKKWTSDVSGHWYACSRCTEKKEFAAHTPGAAATETTPQTCTVCAYVITAAAGHTHTYGNAWSTDANGHWYSCTGCGDRKDAGTHVYDHACDTDCNTCGYLRSTEHTYGPDWVTDADGHRHVCTVCGTAADDAAHTPGAEATDTEPQVCTVCGYVLKPALTADGGWAKDENAHWYICSCGEASDKMDHAWDDGRITKEATDTENGEKVYTCTVCGFEKTEAYEKPAAPETSAPLDPPAPPKDGCGSVLGVPSIALIAVVLPAASLLFRKKREE